MTMTSQLKWILAEVTLKKQGTIQRLSPARLVIEEGEAHIHHILLMALSIEILCVLIPVQYLNDIVSEGTQVYAAASTQIGKEHRNHLKVALIFAVRQR